MKRLKVVLSIVLIVSLLLVSVFSVSAEINNNTIKPDDKISKSLSKKLDLTTEGERIPVCIWYKDIDHEQIEELTYEETGLRASDCDITSSIDVGDMESEILNKSADVSISDYILKTASSREREEELTETYRTSHRNIAIETFNNKSNNIVKRLGINNSNICFKSELAPMMIAELTPEEIQRSADNSEIESISLSFNESEADFDFNYHYINNREQNSGNVSQQAALIYESLGLDKVYQYCNLDGSNVKIGLSEGNAPGAIYNTNGEEITYQDFGFSSNNLLTVTYDPSTQLNSSHTVVQNAIENFQGEGPLKVITVAENANAKYLAPDPHYVDNQPENWHGHANNSVNTMVGDVNGIAQGAQVYFALQGRGGYGDQYSPYYNSPEYKQYANLETIIKCGISVLEVNFCGLEYGNGLDFIDTLNKYKDYLVDFHGITIVVAGGNDIDTLYSPYHEWVNSFGLGANVITVGSCNVARNTVTGDIEYQRLEYRWRNSNDTIYANEKPDVTVPQTINWGGTSTSSPLMTAIISLMMQLKPSLKTQPQIVKALVLASCHFKANPSNLDNEPVETMNGGIPGRESVDSASAITECQGAGVPNAWTMVKMICQHTYGCGLCSATQANIIRVVQPPYEASNLCFSLAWLRNTEMVNQNLEDDDIRLLSSADLKLEVYNNRNKIACSNLLHSSTEMCFTPLLSNYTNNYCLKISSDNYSYARYGYAWSTDNMYLTNPTDAGLFYLRNSFNSGTKYLKKDTNTNLGTVNLPGETTYVLSNDYEWILRTDSNQNCSLQSGNGNDLDYLGVSPNHSGNYYDTAIFNSVQSLKYQLNNDGTITIFNADYSKILRGNETKAVWRNYSSGQTIQGREKWYLDKINFTKGDVDTDGCLDIVDTTLMQRMQLDPSNLGYYVADKRQQFLADVNCDNIFNTDDVSDLFYLLLYSN